MSLSTNPNANGIKSATQAALPIGALRTVTVSDSEEEFEDPPALPIVVNINASTHVTGHNNRIHLPPLSEMKEQYATMVSVAFKTTNTSEDIIEVNIDARVDMKGSGNVVRFRDPTPTRRAVQREDGQRKKRASS
ncbi:MAG: hypothetical protein Q9190_004149, partial [Brigantiaea leucoxantha]